MDAEANNNNNGDQIDVGILNADESNEQQEQPSGESATAGGENVVGAAEDNEDSNSYGGEEPSSLYDVYDALRYANYTGSCCAADKADGSTLTPALPTILGLRVNGVGDLPLPLSDWHAKLLKQNHNTEKINNGSFHKTYSVDSKRVRIKNPNWDASLQKLVQTCAYKLGVDPAKLTAELHSLLFMEKGSRVDRCKNSDEGQNVLGTLFVQLPSVFTGGKISIYNSEEDGEDEEGGDDGDTFTLGTANGDASFSCHFVCHYKDCEYEFDKIKSGSRVLLRYSLKYKGGAPTVSSLNSSMSSLKWSLERLPPADRMMLIPLEKEYTALSLSNNKGINAFTDHHRSYVEAIKAAATGEGWKLLVVTAEMKHVSKEDHGYIFQSSMDDLTIVQFFDEEGHDVTEEEKWLRDVVDFDCADEGMMLADEDDEYAENWGPCTDVSTSTRDSYYGTTTMKRTYKSSFILAYDTTYSETELKCLSGSEGVAEVVETVVETRNYDMLERLLKVVEKKEKSKFDLRTCQKLLQMLTRSRSQKDHRIVMTNKVLSGLSPSLEPDLELFNVMLSTCEKFGHNNVTSGVESILNGRARLKGRDLSCFLLRADFILTFNKRLDNGSTFLEKTISNLPTIGMVAAVRNSNEINSTLFSMIEDHGWEEMASIVEAVLSFIHNRNHSNRTISVLLDRAFLLWKLHNHPCAFLQTCLVDFAKDFAYGMDRSSNQTTTLTQLLSGERQKIFVKAICYLMAHGAADNHTSLGRWAIGSEELFSALLTAIPAQSAALGFDTRVLLRDILNKCLVQQSTANWYSHPIREDGTRDPSLHIKKILKDHPLLPHMVDEEGRITLHYAAATSQAPRAKRASPETINHLSEANPEGVSRLDPVTSLYPFMLAAGNDPTIFARYHISASFSLLLANPNLVACGAQTDVADSRKRKRSDSTVVGGGSL